MTERTTGRRCRNRPLHVARARLTFDPTAMKLTKSFPALWAAAAFVAVPALTAEEIRLLFREDWKETPATTPVTQEHVANPDIVVARRGPAEAQIRKSHHPQIPDDPFYVWSGDTEATWAISLRHRTLDFDLSGAAKIRWRAKQSGYRQLRVIVRLADGRWLVSDQADGEAAEWRVCEFNLAQVTWRVLDIEKVVEGNPEPNPDLRRIEEIGFTDLMRGGRSPASSRLDWIEVYGRAVARPNKP